MEGFTVVGQFQLEGQIVMQLNSLAMSWAEFRELLATQDVGILDDKGELVSEALLMAMDQHRSGKSPLGASWRWMAAVANNGLSLELQLQALPCSLAGLAASPALRQDNVATVVLAKFGTQYKPAASMGRNARDASPSCSLLIWRSLQSCSLTLQLRMSIARLDM
jgi:hypothetical protein